MSIRIHKLAEELGLDNKEMIALLKERKIIAADVKSVSSTVDNISADALREEYAAKRAAAAPAPSRRRRCPATSPIPTGESPAVPSKVHHPVGIFVKTKQDIEREHELAAAARAAASKPAAPVLPVIPVRPAPAPAPLKVPMAPPPMPPRASVPVAPRVAPVSAPPVSAPMPVRVSAPLPPPMAKSPVAPPRFPPRRPFCA
jgi:translation initiation factor IF-2